MEGDHDLAEARHRPLPAVAADVADTASRVAHTFDHGLAQRLREAPIDPAQRAALLHDLSRSLAQARKALRRVEDIAASFAEVTSC